MQRLRSLGKKLAASAALLYGLNGNSHAQTSQLNGVDETIRIALDAALESSGYVTYITDPVAGVIGIGSEDLYYGIDPFDISTVDKHLILGGKPVGTLFETSSPQNILSTINAISNIVEDTCKKGIAECNFSDHTIQYALHTPLIASGSVTLTGTATTGEKTQYVQLREHFSLDSSADIHANGKATIPFNRPLFNSRSNLTTTLDIKAHTDYERTIEQLLLWKKEETLLGLGYSVGVHDEQAYNQHATITLDTKLNAFSKDHVLVNTGLSVQEETTQSRNSVGTLIIPLAYHPHIHVNGLRFTPEFYGQAGLTGSYKRHKITQQVTTDQFSASTTLRGLLTDFDDQFSETHTKEKNTLSQQERVHGKGIFFGSAAIRTDWKSAHIVPYINVSQVGELTSQAGIILSLPWLTAQYDVTYPEQPFDTEEGTIMVYATSKPANLAPYLLERTRLHNSLIMPDTLVRYADTDFLNSLDGILVFGGKTNKERLLGGVAYGTGRGFALRAQGTMENHTYGISSDIVYDNLDISIHGSISRHPGSSERRTEYGVDFTIPF